MLPLPIFLSMLRRTNRRERYTSTQALEAAIAEDRQTNDGAPPNDLGQKVRLETLTVQGVRVVQVLPKGPSSGVTLLYLHGGAHCMEITHAHWNFVAELVTFSGCSVLVPMFPLAPEHVCDDVFVTLDRVLEHCVSDVEQGRLVVMGDSSGGGLALSLAQRLRDAGNSQVGEIILLSPWLDLSLQHAERAASRFVDPWLDLPGMRAAALWWAGVRSLHDPAVSPLFGSFRRLPRLTIAIGGRDILIDECRELKKRAVAEDVPVQWIEERDGIHVWPLLPLWMARRTKRVIVELLREVAQRPRSNPCLEIEC